MANMREFEGLDTVVLDNELACRDVLPVSWTAGEPLTDPFRLATLDEANLLLLQACVAIEEAPQREKKNEDAGPLSAELARLDLKLNLVLQLLGRLVSREALPEATEVTFNALGGTWRPGRGLLPRLAPGDTGLLRIQLRHALPQPLELPARIAAVKGDEVKLGFTHMPEALVELLQRLAFLRHRRSIAEGRKSRA